MYILKYLICVLYSLPQHISVPHPYSVGGITMK